MAHTFEEGELALPIERILWAPTNDAHWNHLHVVGFPRVAVSSLDDCTSKWTEAITTIRGALDGKFGEGDHWTVDDDTLGWTHMGVYNCRHINNDPNQPVSQHAVSNAIDIGPYYGQAQQQKFYDFLTRKKEDDMVSRSDKADEGQENLADNFQAQVAKGIMSQYTQPGGIAFNDEVATFNERFEDYILGEVKKLITEKSTTDSHARNLAQRALDKLNAIKNAI